MSEINFTQESVTQEAKLAAAIVQQPACPCMLLSAQANQTAHTANKKSLAAQEKRNDPKVQAALAKDRELTLKYAVNLAALDPGLWDQMRAKDFPALINRIADTSDFPEFFFPYVSLVHGKVVPATADDLVSSSIFSSCNIILKKKFPGNDTPVCTAIDIPEYFAKDKLMALKRAGVDVILFEASDTQDSLLKYIRTFAQERGVQNLVPDTLPTLDVESKLILNPDMPILIGVADRTLRLANRDALVADGRLGPHTHRAVVAYKQGKYMFTIKPYDSSAQYCSEVSPEAVLEKISAVQPKHTRGLFR